MIPQPINQTRKIKINLHYGIENIEKKEPRDNSLIIISTRVPYG